MTAQRPFLYKIMLESVLPTITKKNREGADQVSPPPDMRLPLIILAVSTVVLWGSFWDLRVLGVNIVLETIRKFLCYLSAITWLNVVFYIREVAAETDIETGEFQREQVKLSMVFMLVTIVSELPVWIASLSLP